MQTIGSMWETWIGQALGPAAPDVVRTATGQMAARRAFYAGVRAMLEAAISNEADHSADRRDTYFAGLIHELHTFEEAKKAGRA